MKIFLVYPPREFYVFGITPHVYVDCESGFYPPIGILYIASFMEKNTDNEIQIVDAYTEKLSHDGLKEKISKFMPDIVGVYFSTYYLYDSILVAKAVKEISKDITVIAGGPHVMLYPQETIDLPEIDYVVYGEGEIIFTQLVERIKNRKSTDDLPAVITKSNSNKKFEKYQTANLDSLPFPARDMIDYKKYRSILAKKNPITTLVTSRGCPYNCYFCSNIESGQKVRFRSAENVVDEIQECIDKFNIHDFIFFDELFTVNRQRVLNICDEIIRRRLKVRWHCRSRADVLDQELVKKMKLAGCRLIQFGIETGNQNLQKVINKNLNLEKVKETVKMVYDNGIYTYADFMFGVPTETYQEMNNTLEFTKMLKLDYTAFGNFHPIPGSVFYDRAIADGKITDYWRDEIIKEPSHPFTRSHLWPDFDHDKLEEFVSRAYKSFYLRPEYVLRRLLRTDSFEQLMWQTKSGLKVFSRFFTEF